MNSSTAILALVSACGLLAGFGIYAAVSSNQGKTALNTADAPEPIGLYSQAVRCGDYVFTSGQISLDPATGALP